MNATEEEQVYAYLKIFKAEKALHLFSVCFEENPSDDSRTCFVFKAGSHQFCCTFSPDKNITLCDIDGSSLREIYTKPARGFNGTDEQGSYWAVEYTLPFSELELADEFLFSQENILYANFLKYWQNSPTLGSFTPIAANTSFPALDDLQAFTTLTF